MNIALALSLLLATSPTPGGGCIDPNGCAAVAMAGSSMDPNGGNRGPLIDPDGRGFSIDPNGGLKARGTLDPDGGDCGSAVDPNGCRPASRQ